MESEIIHASVTEEQTEVQDTEQTYGLLPPSRPGTAQTASPGTSRPNSARRKSWLPANTRDPVVRDNWFSEVLLVLTAVDKHLASGFETAYPPSLSGYCKESVWADFIKDINRAAKLKRKHRFALVFKPMMSKVRIIRQAIDAHLDRRTKPMLIMLRYWQDILKSYGLRAELRKGGQSIDKRLPSSAGISRRSSDIFSSSDSTISSRRSVYLNSSAAASQVELSEECPVRPAFLHSNASRASLASSRSLAIEKYDKGLSGNWELVIYSVKKRSELKSLYTRSRRFSTLSLTGSMKAGRPTTAYMLGEDGSPAKNGRRQSRAKVLSLEELAELPLPPSRSPFTLSKDPSETEQTIDNASGKVISTSKEPWVKQDQNSPLAEPATKPSENILVSKAKRRISTRFPSIETSLSTDPPPVPNVTGPIPSHQNRVLPIPNVDSSIRTCVRQADPPMVPKVPQKSCNLGAKVMPNLPTKVRNSTLVSSTASRSPLSVMAITAENLVSDLDDFADSSRERSHLALHNRFSVANFLSLASSVLTKSGGVASSVADITAMGEVEKQKGQDVVEIKVTENLEVSKTLHRTRSSSILTVLTPLSKPDKHSATMRVVTTPAEASEPECQVRTSSTKI